MDTLSYQWTAPQSAGTFTLGRVPGTGGRPYRFGMAEAARDLDVSAFWIATVPVTEEFWTHVTGAPSPAIGRGVRRPVENVSWTALRAPGGFFDRLNASEVRSWAAMQTGEPDGRFRLPSEAEWEYAARGGPHWRDGFRYSGSDDIDAVAWYDRRWGDHTHDVARKAPNQLGLHDMSGNVWEWCEDTFTPDVRQIPADGRPFAGAGEERVLRGGCFHNWAMHCTVAKRYAIQRDSHDGCIGFRPVFAAAPAR